MPLLYIHFNTLLIINFYYLIIIVLLISLSNIYIDLPWMNIKAKTKKEKYTKIKDKKIEVTPDLLCEGLDEEF